MYRRSSWWVVWFAGAASLGVGCGSSDKDAANPPTPPAGGRATTGGRSASGGSADERGGTSVAGGRAATGGSDATGGALESGGTAGSESGGAAGSESGATEGGAGGDGNDVELGRCREVSRFRYATSDRYVSSIEISRLPGGFLLDPGELSLEPLLILDEVGEGREIPRDFAAQNPSLVPGTWFVAGNEPDLRLMNIRRVDDPDATQSYTGYFRVQSFLESGEALGPEQEVLEIFTRGTAFNHYARSLDGERVALGNVEPVIRDPWMVLVSKDGQQLSDAVHVIDTGGSPFVQCFSVVGTMSGAVGFAVDEGSDRLRMVEIDSTGKVVQDLTRPETTDCPTVSADASGIYVLLRENSDATSPDVYRFEDSQLTKLLGLPEDVDAGYYGLLQGGEQPLIVHFEGQETSFARWKDGALVPLEGTFSTDLLGAAPDGRLFFTSVEDYAVSIATVRCGLLH